MSACRGTPRVHAADSSTEAARRSVGPIGIQLYTVRREMQRDMAATLAAIAAIGYREVEFAGYFGRTPAQVRELLASAGLTAPSTHLAYERVTTDWDRALDEAAAIGHRYVTVPWVPLAQRREIAATHAIADAFNRAGEQARARGLVFAYHNHDFEFVRVDGVLPYDVLLERTDPSFVQFQMDIFWLVKGGGDPIAYMRRFPGRFTMLHVKDSAGPPDHRQVDVGAGVIDFAGILRHDRANGGAVRHLFVEHDQPADALAFARTSFHHMNALEL